MVSAQDAASPADIAVNSCARNAPTSSAWDMAADGLDLQIIEVEVRTTGEQKPARFVASDAIHPAMRWEMGLTGGPSIPSPW